jgi:uroporphyrinogen decarboxylase
MSMSMSGQERVNRMFARKDHDRVPRYESFWGETIERWKEEGLLGGRQEVLDLLEADFQGLNWVWPQPFPGTEKLVAEDATTKVVRDNQGKLVRYWRHKSGTPEHLGFECDSREIWEKKYKPALLGTGIQVDPWLCARNYKEARERGKWCFFAGIEGFEQTRAMIGDEIAMIGMAEDPEWIRDISATHCDVTLQNLDACMATGIRPDGLWIYGDMAFKTATFCSPDMYKEIIWPDHKRLAEWAHAHRMKIIFHTDGDVNGVIDLYLKAGFDCLQPLECKANMDITKLCPAYGDKMAFFGNINVMVMKDNDLAAIEQEIKTKFAAGKKTRGYAYHSDHSVPPQVSWQTYQGVIELVKKYGNYDR